MAKYAYPAVFTEEVEGGYSIHFPDFESCYTSGDNIAHGMEMAEDVLALTLYHYEQENRVIPVPSPMNSVYISSGEFVTYVLCDTLVYRKMNCNRAIKKTLSIPEWLNDAAINSGINFSQVLQDALKAQLNML